MLALGLPKKPSLLSLFLIFRRKCVKRGVPLKWAEAKKWLFFLIGLPLGAPGFAFFDFWASRASFWHLFGCLGIILAPLGPTKMMLRQCKLQWKWILTPTWLGSFFLSFAIPGYHFGTLDPRQVSSCRRFSLSPMVFPPCSHRDLKTFIAAACPWHN